MFLSFKSFVYRTISFRYSLDILPSSTSISLRRLLGVSSNNSRSLGLKRITFNLPMKSDVFLMGLLLRYRNLPSFVIITFSLSLGVPTSIKAYSSPLLIIIISSDVLNDLVFETITRLSRIFVLPIPFLPIIIFITGSRSI